MLVVTGSATAKPDTLEELKRISLDHVRRSRKEPGCVSHGVAADCENPLRLVFFERWADAAALKAHFDVPASREFWRRLQELSSETTEIAIYEAAGVRI